jgi:hypothetical protein
MAKGGSEKRASVLGWIIDSSDVCRERVKRGAYCSYDGN